MLYTISWVLGSQPDSLATFDRAQAETVARQMQGLGAVVFQSSYKYEQGEELSFVAEKPIVLLDLNYTLVANSRQSWPSFQGDPQVEIETYRNWLVELIKSHTVIMVTVRMNHLQQRTMENIQRLTHWQPDEVYMKSPHERFVRAETFKERVLIRNVFPKHGTNPRRYLALESNANTRTMYAQYNIQAVKVPKRPWSTLPPLTPQLGGSKKPILQTQLNL